MHHRYALVALVAGCLSFVPRLVAAGGDGSEGAVEDDAGESAESADAANTSPPTGPAPLSVTISGGGTKGAYMAGQLYYAQQVIKLGNGSLEPRVYTGASAGAINSVASVLAQCAEDAKSPTDSVYWAVWIPTGIRELYRPDLTDEAALFSRSGFEPGLHALEVLWDAGLPESCDVLLGIAITRLKPRTVQLAPGFPSLPRSLETVMLRVTGQGVGRPPRLSNYVDPAQPIPQVILPLDGEEARPFASLEELVFASSAFPVGFTPVDLAHCMSEPGKPPHCTPREASTAQFIDGGVFDNQPLGLSVRAMRSVVRSPAGGLTIADTPATDFLPESRFFFVDPRVTELPRGAGAGDTTHVEGALGVLSEMLGMAESVQSSELLEVFEREASIRDRLLLTPRHLPHVSSTFTGLLDRAFREFDFYLGMYDAARSAKAFGQGERLPETVLARAENGTSRDGWRPFSCLRALFDREGDASLLCGGDELQDFRILARVTLDRLEDQCRASGSSQGDCRAELVARVVPGVPVLPDDERRRLEGEGDFDHLLRLLGLYEFHFRDLGLDREDAADARFALSRLAQEMVLHLASVQPSDALPLSVVGRVGVDVAVGYVPPVHIFHLSLGLGAEFGYSLGIDDPSWTWLRFTTALELDGFSSLLNSDENYMAFIPKLGLEFELLGGSYAQLRLGFRGGFQFSSGDSLTREDCDFTQEDAVPCSRVMTEAYFASSFLGLMRLHVAGVIMPAMHEDQSLRFAVRPMVGIQLNSPF